MAKKYRHRVDGIKLIALKMLKIALFILLSYFAVRIGVMGGDAFSSLDVNLVENVDIQNFKSTLNKSLPFIDTVYNSGKISVSFTGEFKSIINNIFEFDLNNPLTILNAQSPYFYSYYNKNRRHLAAARDQEKGPDAADGAVNENDSPADDTTAPGDKVPTPEDKTVPPEDKTVTQKDKTAVPEDKNTVPGDKTGAAEGTAGIPGHNAGELREDASSVYFEEDQGERDFSKIGIISNGRLTIRNETNYKIDIDKLLKEPLKFKLSKKGPKILIFHTHTTESYISNLKELNNKDKPSWTLDARYNVVRVGEELAQNLRRKYGIDTMHNGFINDYPNYNSSYATSLNTVSKILKGNPSIKIVLDIHRDGLRSNEPKLRTAARINNKNAAKIMFVVGSDSAKLSNPNWRENLKFALKLQEKLNEECPGLVKPIYLSKYRYNQHLSTGALIVEIGGDGDLLSECMESTKYLSRAINDVIN